MLLFIEVLLIKAGKRIETSFPHILWMIAFANGNSEKQWLSTEKHKTKQISVYKKAMMKISTSNKRTYQQTAAIEKWRLGERCQQI